MLCCQLVYMLVDVSDQASQSAHTLRVLDSHHVGQIFQVLMSWSCLHAGKPTAEEAAVYKAGD